MPSKLSNRQAVIRLYNLFKNEYVFCDVYKGLNTSIKVKHDILKKEYAIKHNYVLVLIPYTVTTIFELDIILKKYIHGVKQGVSNQN